MLCGRSARTPRSPPSRRRSYSARDCTWTKCLLSKWRFGLEQNNGFVNTAVGEHEALETGSGSPCTRKNNVTRIRRQSSGQRSMTAGFRYGMRKSSMSLCRATDLFLTYNSDQKANIIPSSLRRRNRINMLWRRSNTCDNILWLHASNSLSRVNAAKYANSPTTWCLFQKLHPVYPG